MSDPIDEQIVRRTARLARLDLSDDEVALFTTQLARIVAYVRQIESLDTEGIEPLSHPLPIAAVLREDVPRESLDPEAALANAPQRHGPYFRVPRVLDDAGGA